MTTIPERAQQVLAEHYPDWQCDGSYGEYQWVECGAPSCDWAGATEAEHLPHQVEMLVAAGVFRSDGHHAVERYDPYGNPEYAGIRVDGAYVFNDAIPDEHLRLQVSRAQAVLDFRAAERADR